MNRYLQCFSCKSSKGIQLLGEAHETVLICQRNSTLPGDAPAVLPAHLKPISSTIAIRSLPPCTKVLIKDKVSRKLYWRLILVLLALYM